MTKTLLGTVDIRDLRSGGLMEGHIYEGFDEGNLADFRDRWKPVLQAAHDKLRSEGRLTIQSLGALNAQDFHWKWEDKLAGRLDPLVWRSFTLEAEGETQGLMSVSLSPLSHGSHRDDMVYVDLLSSAPWNRPGLVAERRFKAVGAYLLATAAGLSVDEGFEGRLGLHSLPQSEDWYRDKCNMTDHGRDPRKQNLRYFEMTEEQARAFLRDGS